jgi:arginine repressor
MVNIHSLYLPTRRSIMTIKALIRKLTGKGGAINRATSSRDVCRLNAIALAARVSVWELD